MTDLEAALGLVQLRRLPQFHTRRCQITKRYSAAFSQLDDFEIPPESADVEHAWHLYVLRLNPTGTLSRNQMIAELRDRNIGTSVHFIPVHLHKYYREKYGFRPEDFPVASREFDRIISLPLSPRMSDADVEDVITAVLDTVRQQPRSSPELVKAAVRV